MPGAPVNGVGSLDINVYCKGYVAWDFTAMFIQVRGLLQSCMLVASILDFCAFCSSQIT